MLLFVGSARPLSIIFPPTRVDRAHQRNQIQSPLLIASNTELIDSSGALFMYELTQPEPDEKGGKCGA